MAETLQPTGIVIPNADGKEAISPVGVAELRATGVTANAAIRAAALTQGTMPLNADLDSWVDDSWNGLWHASAATAATVTGVPDGTQGQAFQLLQLGSQARVTTQLYIPYGFYTTGLMTRSVSNVTTRTWTEWAPLGAASLDPMTQHAIRQTEMIHAIGPVDTGGLGAVAFRFDHGFTNFRDKVLPAVKSRGIKVAQAYNPRNWHYAENTGVTATDLNGWVAAGDVEIMNHSADHLPAETRAALYAEIVNGLAEIEAELPAARGKVWGFAPPGVSSGNWMGFNDGRTPEGWDTYAGHLILKHHAVGTGYLPGTSRRVLDGQIRDGLGHVTIDGRAVADIKADIDSAVASRMGVQLMMHPSQLDTAGKLTMAQFLEVLDYAVAKRDAGALKILSPYQMLVANATRVGTYDSGWRDVSADLRSGATGTLHIRREGMTVWWRTKDLDVGAGHAFYWPPVGMLAPSEPLSYPPQSSSNDFPFYIDNTGRLCRDLTAPNLTPGRWWTGCYVLPSGTLPDATPPGIAV